MIRSLSLIAVLGLLGGGAHASTVQASDCSSSAVQTAINSAANGDTVMLPSSCSTTWNTGVTIPNTKGLTLNGNGAAITRGSLASGVPVIEVDINSSTSTRVTGFKFSDSQSSTGYFITVGGGNESSAKFRIDHNTFTGLSMLTHIRVVSPIYGVIDHNTLTWSSNNEVIHYEAYGPNSTAGWSNAVVPGSANALYIEDNTFTNQTSGNPAYFWGGSAVQGYYGARTVVRHNNLTMAQIDMHGTAGMIGARWWEIYENTFSTQVANANQDTYIDLRAGSGVVFNNHQIGSNGGGGYVKLREEDTGAWPQLYQIGRGQNQTSDPAYVWGNDSSMHVGPSGTVTQGVDFFVSAKPGYTPYTYPHPMVTGAAQAVTLTPPTGLAVVQ